MRNDDATPLKKLKKNSMQMSYGLCWRFLVDFAYLNESVENIFLVVSFTQKTRNFQPSGK